MFNNWKSFFYFILFFFHWGFLLIFFFDRQSQFLLDQADAEAALFIQGFEKTMITFHDIIETTAQLLLTPQNQIPSLQKYVIC